MIQTLLQQLGLSQKETLIYLTVLQQGKISIADIAKLTRLNRTTVYALAKKLLQRNIIHEQRGKTTYLLARPPEDLHILLEREEQSLNRKKHLLQNALKELEPLARGARYSVPRMEFVEEEQMKAFLYKNMEKWTESMFQYDGVWRGFQDHSFVEHYADVIDWHWQQPFAKDMQLQLLTNQSVIEEKMRKKNYRRRHMKFWTESPIKATTFVVGDYLLMIITRTHPHYLFEIHDRILAETMREMMKRLWEDSPENGK